MIESHSPAEIRSKRIDVSLEDLSGLFPTELFRLKKYMREKNISFEEGFLIVAEEKIPFTRETINDLLITGIRSLSESKNNPSQHYRYTEYQIKENADIRKIFEQLKALSLSCSSILPDEGKRNVLQTVFIKNTNDFFPEEMEAVKQNIRKVVDGKIGIKEAFKIPSEKTHGAVQTQFAIPKENKKQVISQLATVYRSMQNSENLS